MQPPTEVPQSGTLVGASLWTLGAAGISFLLALVQAKVAALVLGAAGVGIVANLGGYIPLVATLAFAVAGQGAVREIASARARGNDDEVAAVARYTAFAPLVLGVAATVLTIAIAPTLAALLVGEPAFAPLVMTAALAIPAMLAVISYQAVLQGHSRVGTIARATMAGGLIGTAASLALILAFGVPGALAGLVVSAVIQLAAFAVAAPWTLRLLAGVTRWVPRNVRTIAAFGAASVTLLVASHGSTLLVRSEIARRLGLDAAGLYQPVAAVSDTYLELLIASTSVYLFPRLSALFATGALAEAGTEIARGLRLLIVVVTPVLVLAAAFSSPLLTLLYAAAFAPAAQTFELQMVGNVAKVVAWSVGAALLPAGLVRAWLLIGLVTVALRYGLANALIGDFGLVGVAIGYDVAWSWSAVASCWCVFRIARIRVPWADVAAALLAAGAVSAVVAAKVIAPALVLPATALSLLLWLLYARARAGALVLAVRQGLARS